MSQAVKFWGPWIKHDGSGCPVVGRLVNCETFSGERFVVHAGEECREAGVDPNGPQSAWVWSRPRMGCIIRYRVKRSPGMEMLQAILRDVRQLETERA